MSCVAIIPARGGSKRIPRKNIKPFAGKPIVGYSIEAALQSRLFDRVIVSTDDPEIAAVAESFGAEVPFLRPVELAPRRIDAGSQQEQNTVAIGQGAHRPLTVGAVVRAAVGFGRNERQSGRQHIAHGHARGRIGPVVVNGDVVP